MRKLTAIIPCVATIVCLLVGCGSGNTAPTASVAQDGGTAGSIVASSTDVLTFKLGMVDPDGSNFHKGALAIAEEVEKATKGRIKIKVFAGGQLGNERDMYEGAQLGTIDMFTASNAVLTSFIPEMTVLDQPFLFNDADEAHRVIDGQVGQLIAEKTAAQSIHTVGWMDVGFRNVFSTRPVKTIEDFKGLKIRTMENDLHIAAFNALGAIATPMASGEVFTALQQGAIEAAENAVANLVANRYYEVTKNVTMTNHVFGFMGVFMSDKAYNSIPADLLDAFMSGIKAGADRQRQYLVEANESAREELVKLGVNFYEIPIDELHAVVDPAMEQFSDRIDPDWAAAIEADKAD
ncbi:tripartite ATP-independent transporter DctP family solute receptor [Moryella indoligenes]|uniref:Tripartite ATP-independent transporter DctP family solute receptor n=1 Tax=Moryella indoligenes TaxID=371674 RepID=A0AAE3VCG3_9FIRM|nr:TRAP transporter substrate-binding protein [Moryella indoligenes]MDQ0153630.1 tripartite ATP-independent transporter DctP family solute receptor [Moryella indoligenes]